MPRQLCGVARDVLRALCVATALCASARAQAFNIDIGANVTFPLPGTIHGGAIGQVGTWNAVSGVAAGSVGLVDISGSATGVTIAQANGAANLDSNNANTAGDVERLLDDAQAIAAAGTTSWTLSGLANGPYRVVVYAWAPDAPVATVTQVSVVGGALGPRNCGGANFTDYLFGVTHVADTVSVTAGTISIQLSNVSSVGRCNGIQIEPLPANFGAVLRGPFGLTGITGRQEHQSLAALGNDYWTTGADTVGGIDTMYRIDATSLVATAITGTPCTRGRDATAKLGSGVITHVVYQTHGTQTCRYEYSGSTLVSCTPVISGAAGGTFLPQGLGTPFNPTREYFVYDDGTGQLWAQDLGFVAVPIALSPGVGHVFEGLAWADATQKLWGFARFNAAGGVNDRLLVAEIDPFDGRLTGKAFQGLAGLAGPNVAGGCEIHFDPNSPSTMTLATVHVATAPSSDSIVAYDLAIPISGPVNYCTPGTSTNACAAVMAVTGLLSASFASSCIVSASNVEGQKTGLLFYGVSGQSANLWCGTSTSFLCVKAPTQRTPAQNSGGLSGLCNGSYALDANNYFQFVNPGALGMPFSAGNVLDWQGWYRDPPACKSTQLTDGLQMLVLP